MFRRLVWITAHRLVVLVVVTAVAGFLIVKRLREPVVVADPPGAGVRVDQVAGKLDPNTASVADLSSIPALGEKKAAEIVAYREEHLRRHAGSPAFNCPDDLLVLKGIGVSTVRNMEPYLVLPKGGPGPP